MKEILSRFKSCAKNTTKRAETFVDCTLLHPVTGIQIMVAVGTSVMLFIAAKEIRNHYESKEARSSFEESNVGDNSTPEHEEKVKREEVPPRIPSYTP